MEIIKLHRLRKDLKSIDNMFNILEDVYAYPQIESILCSLENLEKDVEDQLKEIEMDLYIKSKANGLSTGLQNEQLT